MSYIVGYLTATRRVVDVRMARISNLFIMHFDTGSTRNLREISKKYKSKLKEISKKSLICLSCTLTPAAQEIGEKSERNTKAN